MANINTIVYNSLSDIALKNKDASVRDFEYACRLFIDEFFDTNTIFNIREVDKYEGHTYEVLEDLLYGFLDDWDDFSAHEATQLGFKVIGDKFYIPAKSKIKFIEAHGPGGGWPVIEFNGEEYDFAGDEPFHMKLVN